MTLLKAIALRAAMLGAAMGASAMVSLNAALLSGTRGGAWRTEVLLTNTSVVALLVGLLSAGAAVLCIRNVRSRPLLVLRALFIGPVCGVLTVSVVMLIWDAFLLFILVWPAVVGLLFGLAHLPHLVPVHGLVRSPRPVEKVPMTGPPEGAYGVVAIGVLCLGLALLATLSGRRFIPLGLVIAVLWSAPPIILGLAASRRASARGQP